MSTDHSRDFQQIADRLSTAADDKNLDGAALLWYLQLTLNYATLVTLDV